MMRSSDVPPVAAGSPYTANLTSPAYGGGDADATALSAIQRPTSGGGGLQQRVVESASRIAPPSGRGGAGLVRTFGSSAHAAISETPLHRPLADEALSSWKRSPIGQGAEG